MTRLMRAMLAGAGAILVWVSAVWAQPKGAEPIYRFDPALSIEVPRQPAISADPSVIVEQREERTSVRLQTEGPITPYLEAEERPELSAEEMRLLQDKLGRDVLSDYRLEAGNGVLVEDRASFNLGYRFHDATSRLDDRRDDPLSLSGDLRISFDFKVPFD